jgi:hypothetical protein
MDIVTITALDPDPIAGATVPLDMIRRDGRDYPTLAEAASELGVSAKTVRDWINRGVLPPPPEFEYGLRFVAYFPPEYLQMARETISAQRTEAREQRSRSSNNGPSRRSTREETR